MSQLFPLLRFNHTYVHLVMLILVMTTNTVLYAKETETAPTSNNSLIDALKKESEALSPSTTTTNKNTTTEQTDEPEASSIPNQSSVADLQKVYQDTFNDNFVGKIKYPAWFHQSDFLNYQEDLSEAVQQGKKGAFLLFTTQGCPYCDKFINLSLGNAEIAKKVQQDFMPTGLEIFNDIEITNFNGEEMPAKDFAKKTGVQFTPTLIFYDKQGKQVFQAIGYQSPEQFKHILNYVADEHYHTQNLHSYIKQQPKKAYQPSMADQLISGLYEETVATTLFDSQQVNFDPKTQASPRPLVVLFEEDNCQDCVDFHENILPIKAVRQLLKQFHVVKFNANDNKTALTNPDKTATTPAQWVKALNFQHFPALVFFDKTGRQVLQTDALLRKKRMLYSCQYVLENAFDKGWSYQRFGRFKEGKKK